MRVEALIFPKSRPADPFELIYNRSKTLYTFMLLKILTVLALATFEIYAAIPAGFAFGLSPWVILLASTIGGWMGAFAAAFLGDRLRKLLFKNPKPKQPKNSHPMLTRIWNRYGTIGLGFLGSLIVGAPISIAIGVGLNANLRKLLAWCCAGVVSRCTLFTVIGYYGLKLF
jgi:membrane protein YqaA with SNARE-associated domain